jgi:hypothetical protein
VGFGLAEGVRLVASNPNQNLVEDLIGLVMQEPQYGSPGVRELMNAVAKSRVPCISIMNMPPFPYMRRIPGIEAKLLKPAYTAPEVWKDFDPGAITLCSPDPQAIRPLGEKANVLQVMLPTNFKVACFDFVRGNEIVRQLEKEIDAAWLDTPEGKIELPVKLRSYDSIYVPLAKWAMLIAGNYRCITDDGIRTARDAVHSDLEASRSIYDFVLDICVKIGASRDELVPFEKYAAAAENLSRPASAARALNNGAPNIERADKLVQLAAKQKGMSHPARCDSGAGRSKTRDKSEDEARCGIVRQYTVLKNFTKVWPLSLRRDSIRSYIGNRVGRCELPPSRG